MQKTRIWDLPTRLFHWSFAASVTGAIVTAKIEEMDLHLRFAFAVCVLLIFRVMWGFVGSETARFSHFVKGPGAIRGYLRGEWSRVGHNPLGALSVIGLLGVIGLQVTTGLFSNDDVLFEGPWAGWIGSSGSTTMTGRHHLLEKAVLVLVILHIAAIVFYRFRKNEHLVRPMIVGTGEIPTGASSPAMVPAWRALPVLAVSVAISGAIFRYWLL